MTKFLGCFLCKFPFFCLILRNRKRRKQEDGKGDIDEKTRLSLSFVHVKPSNHSFRTDCPPFPFLLPAAFIRISEKEKMKENTAAGHFLPCRCVMEFVRLLPSLREATPARRA